VRARIWVCIWQGAGYKLDPYFLKCEQHCGSVFGKVRATNWTHIF
jgi:hypothetical protein